MKKKKNDKLVIAELSANYSKTLKIRHSKDDFETIEFLLNDQFVFNMYAESLDEISQAIQEAIRERKEKRAELK